MEARHALVECLLCKFECRTDKISAEFSESVITKHRLQTKKKKKKVLKYMCVEWS